MLKLGNQDIGKFVLDGLDINTIFTSRRRGGYSIKLYASSINGNDANDGLSPSAPVATWNKLKTLIEPGSIIYAEKGSEWQGDSDFGYEETGNNDESGCILPLNQEKYRGCKFTTYGTGDKPIIDLSLNVPNANWSKTVGRTNIYQYTVDISDVGYEQRELDDYRGCWEDGELLIQILNDAMGSGGLPVSNQSFATDSDALDYLDANPGHFYATNVSGNSITYYVHATNSENVITNSRKYDVRKWKTFVVARVSDETLSWDFDGFHVTKSWNHGGAIIGNFINLNNFLIEHTARHGILINGCTIQNTIIRKMNPATSAAGCFHAINYEGVTDKNLTYINCQAEGLGQYYGFYAHQSGTSGEDFNTATYLNCKAIDCYYQVTHRDVKNVVIDSFVSENCDDFAYQSGAHITGAAKNVTISKSLMQGGIRIEGNNTIVNFNDSYTYIKQEGVYVSLVSSPENCELNFNRSILIFDDIPDPLANTNVFGGVIGADSSINFDSCYLGVLGNVTTDVADYSVNFGAKPNLGDNNNAQKIKFTNTAAGAFCTGNTSSRSSNLQHSLQAINEKFGCFIGENNVWAIEKETIIHQMTVDPDGGAFMFYDPILFSGAIYGTGIDTNKTFTGLDYATITFPRFDNGLEEEFWEEYQQARLFDAVGSESKMPSNSINYTNGTISPRLTQLMNNPGEDMTLVAAVINRVGQLDDMVIDDAELGVLIKSDSRASFLFEGFSNNPGFLNE